MMTTWLAAGHAGGNGSAMGRIALAAVAVLAVVAYALLQLRARSGRIRAARRYDPWDWRTYPPESGPAGRDAGEPYGNEESSRPTGGTATRPGTSRIRCTIRPGRRGPSQTTRSATGGP